MVSISRADYLMRFMTVNAAWEFGLVGLTAIFADRLVFEPADPLRKSLEEFFYILSGIFIGQFCRSIEQRRRRRNLDFRLRHHVRFGKDKRLTQ